MLADLLEEYIRVRSKWTPIQEMLLKDAKGAFQDGVIHQMQTDAYDLAIYVMSVDSEMRKTDLTKVLQFSISMRPRC